MHRGSTWWKRKFKLSWRLPLPPMSLNSKPTWDCLIIKISFFPIWQPCSLPAELLRKDVRWKWQKRQEEDQNSKTLLNSAHVLVHYSADRVISGDVSQYGVGAVLSDRMKDDREKPLSFMSRTLSPAENRYSPLDKEGFAVMSGIQKFRKYLCGCFFTI